MNPPTRDYDEDMAAQAAAVFFGHEQPGSANAFRDALNVFAPLVAAREREECAKVADTMYGQIARDPDDYVGKDMHSSSWDLTCLRIASGIRARSNNSI